MTVLSEHLNDIGGGNSATYNAGYAMGSAMASAVESFGRAFESYDGSFCP